MHRVRVTLDQHICGMLQLLGIHGNTPKFMMQVRVQCGSICVQRLGTVTITEANLHMHASGRKIIVRLIRDGKELRPIAIVGQ